MRISKLTVTYYFEASSPENYKNDDGLGPGDSVATYEDVAAYEEKLMNIYKHDDYKVEKFLQYRDIIAQTATLEVLPEEVTNGN